MWTLIVGSAFIYAATACTTDADCVGLSSFATCNTGTSVCECTATPSLDEIAALDFAALSSVECNTDGIVVRIDACALEASRYALADLYLDGAVESMVTDLTTLDTSADNTCVGALVEDDGGPFFQYDIASPISDCNMLITTNATHHTFRNAVQGYQGSEGAVVTRLRKFMLSFECVYPISSEVSAAYAVNAVLTEVSFRMDEIVGDYIADFGLYSDAGLTTLLSAEDQVWIPDYFHGKIRAEVPDSDRFVTKLMMCWATPTDDPMGSTVLPLVEDGCPVSSDADEGSDDVVISKNAEGDEVIFKVRAFTWVDEAHGDKMFVHCLVSLCDYTAGTCTPTCSARRKRRAISKTFREKRNAYNYYDYYTYDMYGGYGTGNEEIITETFTHGGFKVGYATTCQDGGEDACNRGHFTRGCKTTRRFSLRHYMKTGDRFLIDYECQCQSGYGPVRNTKHHCQPMDLPDLDILSYY